MREDFLPRSGGRLFLLAVATRPMSLSVSIVMTSLRIFCSTVSARCASMSSFIFCSRSEALLIECLGENLLSSVKSFIGGLTFSLEVVRLPLGPSLGQAAEPDMGGSIPGLPYPPWKRSAL